MELSRTEMKTKRWVIKLDFDDYYFAGYEFGMVKCRLLKEAKIFDDKKQAQKFADAHKGTVKIYINNPKS